MNQLTEVFGLLGPEQLPSSRRLRTLGLGATVRYFNDRALPGMGGVWFAKQLVLALFGVRMAQRAGRSNVEVANAIEALGCALAILHRKAAGDPRVRGARKLANVSIDDLAFERVRKRGFYVSQPMRMATVQALPALGLVSAGSTRFNAFECTTLGKELLADFTTKYRPWNGELETAMERWIRGGNVTFAEAITQALSPCDPLPEKVRNQLLARIADGHPGEPQDDHHRRRCALALVERRRQRAEEPIDWTQRPAEIESEAHWHDLEAGRRLMLVRNAALELLVALEGAMPASRTMAVDRVLLNGVATQIEQLRRAAHSFLEARHAHPEANRFCAECAQDDPGKVVRAVVERDGVVLVRVGEQVAAGPLFVGPSARAVADGDEAQPSPVGADTEDDAEGGPRAGVEWPPGTSFRLNHLFLLNLDLHDELPNALRRAVNAEGATS
jgi:hypothetical protein